MNNKVFYWFKDNNKKFEVRGYLGIQNRKSRWNEKNVTKGRRVELRRGYGKTKDKILGFVGNIIIGTLK